MGLLYKSVVGLNMRLLVLGGLFVGEHGSETARQRIGFRLGFSSWAAAAHENSEYILVAD